MAKQAVRMRLKISGLRTCGFKSRYPHYNYYIAIIAQDVEQFVTCKRQIDYGANPYKLCNNFIIRFSVILNRQLDLASEMAGIPASKINFLGWLVLTLVHPLSNYTLCGSYKLDVIPFAGQVGNLPHLLCRYGVIVALKPSKLSVRARIPLSAPGEFSIDEKKSLFSSEK